MATCAASQGVAQLPLGQLRLQAMAAGHGLWRRARSVKRNEEPPHVGRDFVSRDNCRPRGAPLMPRLGSRRCGRERIAVGGCGSAGVRDCFRGRAPKAVDTGAAGCIAASHSLPLASGTLPLAWRGRRRLRRRGPSQRWAAAGGPPPLGDAGRGGPPRVAHTATRQPPRRVALARRPSRVRQPRGAGGRGARVGGVEAGREHARWPTVARPSRALVTGRGSQPT